MADLVVGPGEVMNAYLVVHRNAEQRGFVVAGQHSRFEGRVQELDRRHKDAVRLVRRVDFGQTGGVVHFDVAAAQQADAQVTAILSDFEKRDRFEPGVDDALHLERTTVPLADERLAACLMPGRGLCTVYRTAVCFALCGSTPN